MYRQLLLILPAVVLPALVFAADDQAKKASKIPVAIKPGPDDPKETVKPGPIDKDAPTTFKTTKSGLKYRILRKSTKAKPTETDIVDMHFKGWLDDEKKTIFRSSYRRGKTKSFPVSRVMRGWTEGLQLLGKGGMIELIVPPELGYGKKGKKGEIPPNARLHFIIELIDFHREIKII